VILALKTTEIAAYGRHGERAGSRQEVKERLFFDRIHMERDGAAIHKRIKNPLSILPDPTKAPLRGQDRASMVAEMTSNFSLLQRAVEQCLFHPTFSSFSEPSRFSLSTLGRQFPLI